MEQYKKEFIELMVDCQVLKFGDFVTKSGRKTPFFVNTGFYRTGAQLRKLGEYYAKAINDTFGTDFDVLFGHRRDPLGYGKSLEEFDSDLGLLLDALREDDVLMITADHGNDPTWYGTDHTREVVPLLTYSKSFKNGREIPQRFSFGCIGKTILKNFGVKPSENEIGEPIDEILSD